MRKNILVLYVLSFCFLTQAAQVFGQAPESDYPKKGYIGVSFGSSSAVGAWATNNTGNIYATGGYNFDILYGTKFSKYFGFTADLRVAGNGSELIYDPSGGLTISNLGTFSYVGIMVGAYGEYPLTKRLYLDGKIMIGDLTFTQPGFNINYTDPSTNTTYNNVATVNSASSNAFSYLLSIGLNYDLSRRFNIFWNINYLGSTSINFTSDVTITNPSNNSTIDQKINNNYSVQTINTSIGLAWRFLAKQS